MSGQRPHHLTPAQVAEWDQHSAQSFVTLDASVEWARTIVEKSGNVLAPGIIAVRLMESEITRDGAVELAAFALARLAGGL